MNARRTLKIKKHLLQSTALILLACLPLNAASPSDNGMALPAGWSVAADNHAKPGAAGFRIRHDGLGLEMAWVPGGTLAMGGRHIPKTRIEDETPVHEVELTGFWIGRTEVTVAQWRAVMQRVPDHNDRGEHHPVVNVTWHDCIAFCQRTGLALPTEAQWEYAARGTNTMLSWNSRPWA